MSFIEKPPEGSEGWRRVWRENLAYRVEKPTSALRRFARRLFRKIVRNASLEETERQRNFNLALLEMLDDARRDLSSLHTDLVRDLAALGEDFRTFQDRLPVAVQRNDALLAALDQKIETIAVRIRDLTTPLLTAERAASREDYLYRRMEDGLRGSTDQVRESLRDYLAFAKQSAPVVDLGCGRGEFLELCRDAGIPARGFDTNERSVADLKAKGLEVELKGIPDCFSALAPGSAGAILATHVVEHLPSALLFEFFAGASSVLRKGGLLMIETPNAESLFMAASEFWRDPTHLAPRHVAALTLLAREFGFEIEDLRPLHPFPPARQLKSSGADDASRELVNQLNEVLFAPQDLRLVLRKA